MPYLCAALVALGQFGKLFKDLSFITKIRNQFLIKFVFYFAFPSYVYKVGRVCFWFHISVC
ncbi:hypothetical protein VV208B2_32170 [Vibrio vulnificus]|nr:hypothetical protein VV208B2_32170 [Vibrio vulnificus]